MGDPILCHTLAHNYSFRNQYRRIRDIVPDNLTDFLIDGEEERVARKTVKAVRPHRIDKLFLHMRIGPPLQRCPLVSVFEHPDN